MAIPTDGNWLHDEPLAPVCELWTSLANIAKEHKKEIFQDDADEAMRFYCKKHDDIYNNATAIKSKYLSVSDGGGDVQSPKFRVTANLTAEAVELFGPVLYHRNPIRTVRPRELPQISPAAFGINPQTIAVLSGQIPPGMPPPPIDPQQQQLAMMYQQGQQQDAQEKEHDGVVAMLMEKLLNYTPNEFDLKGEMRKGIDEAIIKGRGCWLTELFTPPHSDTKNVGSFYFSCDNLLLDPDAEVLDDCMWAMIRCEHPTWKVEREYKLKPDTLKSNRESLNQQAASSSDKEGSWKRKLNETQDTITYYKVWSRMGIGGRLKSSAVDSMRDQLEIFGDYVYLVIVPGHPYPINIPQELVDAEMTPEVQQQIVQSCAWPIPYWADPANPFPFTVLDFHEIPRQVWPLGHLTPASGYQQFLDWLYSCMMTKVYNTHRDIYLTDATATADFDDALENGKDFINVKVKKNPTGKLSDLVEVLQAPRMQGDMLPMAEKVEQLFQRATGLNEVMYGSQGTQSRSAEESRLKGDMTRLRPDDMKSRVEDCAAEISRKEALASRWFLEGKDVEPILGKMGAMIWEQSVMGKDVPYIVREFEYRVEAGSAAKPNHDLDIANSNDAAQFLWPSLVGLYQATGNPGPANAFIKYWAKGRQLDVQEFLLPPLQIPPDAPAGPSPQQQQQEMGHAEQQHQTDMAKQHQGMGHDEQIHAIEVKKQQKELSLLEQEIKTTSELHKAAMQQQKAKAKAA